MTTNLLAHCHLLHLKKKPRDDDKPFCSLLSSKPKKNVENDNELGGSLSSFATKAKQPKMTMSQDLGSSSFSTPEEKKPKDDNEPLNSLLSSTFEKKMQKNNNELGGLLLSYVTKAK